MSAPQIIAGIGLREAAGHEALAEALKLTGKTPDALAVLAEKAAFSAIGAFVQETGLPLIAIKADEIAGIPTLTCSPRIKSRFATGSVAEALALAAAGRYGAAQLLTPRMQSSDGMATVAIAATRDPGMTK